MNSQRSAGLRMIGVAWVLVFLLAVFAFDSYLINPNRNPSSSIDDQAAIVVLKDNRNKQYEVGGSINGQKVTFFVDTGATNVAVPGGLAAKLGLKKGRPIQVMTANGRAKAYATTINTIKIGDITLSNVVGSINPTMDDGILLLGMSALKNLEIRHKDGELTLIQYQ